MHKHDLEKQKSTEGMVDYDQNSAAQQNIVLQQSTRIKSLVERLEGVDARMRVADYGCGPGTSAITAVQPAIDVYRSRFPDGELAVCHADQPGNDWNALFKLVWGPSGYQNDTGVMRTEACVGSFYEQLLTTNSVDMGTCFAASHWLSHALRVNFPGALWFADLEGEARQKLAALARRDWIKFLSMRAQELRTGGFLLVSTLGCVPDASETNGAAASGRGIYRALQVIAQGMADDGLINGDILAHFVFSMWFMTEEEARAPIEEDQFLSNTYEIESIAVKPAPGNYRDVFGHLLSDPADYAKTYTGYIRAFADSTLRSQLLGPSAENGSHENELANEFYRRLNELYRLHLSEYAFELWHLTVVLRRK